MASESKKKDVILLLRDYMNIIPSGAQEAYVPIGTGTSAESSWPLTAESELRMDRNSAVGEAYADLDRALIRLSVEDPEAYAAIVVMYLHEEAGHRDVDHFRQVALTTGRKEVVSVVEKHDRGIDTLADYLEDIDMWVRRPRKASGPKPAQDMQAKHEELFSVFLRFIQDDNLPYRQSINNAVFKVTDVEGEPYYSKRHAERIIKPKWAEYQEQHEKRG